MPTRRKWLLFWSPVGGTHAVMRRRRWSAGKRVGPPDVILAGMQRYCPKTALHDVLQVMELDQS
jgi:hypothetical protein